MEWTFEQARKAKLTSKDNWLNYPRAMLRARCIAEGVRAVYPAAIGGLLVAEEAQDLPKPSKAMGSVEVVEAEGPSDELLEAACTEADKGIDAYSQWWKSITKEQRVLLSNEHGGLKNRASEADKARTVEADPSTQEQADFAAELDTQ